jgi:Ca2+-binding EF-hand superfamily protein
MADKNVQELVNKVQELVRRNGGNLQQTFNRYASKRVAYGELDQEELETLLKDADVGNGLTRSTWASRIITRLDTDRNGRISYLELETILNNPNNLPAK